MSDENIAVYSRPALSAPDQKQYRTFEDLEDPLDELLRDAPTDSASTLQPLNASTPS